MSCCVRSPVGGWWLSGLFRLVFLAAQWEASRHDNLGASPNLHSLDRFLHTCKSEGGLGVSGQPGGQVCRTLEVEQGIGQGFQLLHW